MNTEIALITSNDDIMLLLSAAAERHEYLYNRVSKMPKMKALELIAQSYPGYETTDVYTVKDNLAAAYGEYCRQLNERGIQIREAEIAAAQPSAYDLTTVDGILHALKNGAYLGGPAETSTQRKNLRSKLRKLGYRLSEQKAE